MWRSTPGSSASDAVGGRGARVELARLCDGAAGQLGARDPGREAEVVLDPPRRAGLAAERGAFDDQRLETLGRGVDRRPEARRTAADHDDVDLLASRELEPDTERAGELAARRVSQLGAAGEHHERKFRRCELLDQLRCVGVVGVLRIAPDVGKPVASQRTPRAAASTPTSAAR